MLPQAPTPWDRETLAYLRCVLGCMLAVAVAIGERGKRKRPRPAAHLFPITRTGCWAGKPGWKAGNGLFARP